MSVNEIIKAAVDNGLVLFIKDEKISIIGILPENWVELFALWIPRKNEILEYLKSPPAEYRALVARALVNQAKRKSIKCIHRGTLIHPRPACGCGPLYTCEIFGQCVLNGNTRSWKVCTGCERYQNEGEGHDLSGAGGSDPGA